MGEPMAKKRKTQIKKDGLCEMCEAKEQLRTYERMIVDYISNAKIRELEVGKTREVYSYKIPYQEKILQSEF